MFAAAFALIGTWLLRAIQAGALLSTFGGAMISCYSLVIWGPDTVAPYALIGLGAFISIMFPTIFSLSIDGLRDFTENGSALLNFAIVGGAVFPPLQGVIADFSGIELSYIVPAFCILIVIFYGMFMHAQKRQRSPSDVRATLHD